MIVSQQRPTRRRFTFPLSTVGVATVAVAYINQINQSGESVIGQGLYFCRRICV